KDRPAAGLAPARDAAGLHQSGAARVGEGRARHGEAGRTAEAGTPRAALGVHRRARPAASLRRVRDALRARCRRPHRTHASSAARQAGRDPEAAPEGLHGAEGQEAAAARLHGAEGQEAVTAAPRRSLPAVGTLLELEGVRRLLATAPRDLVTD